MQNHIARALLAGLALGLLLAADSRVHAVDADPAVQKIFDKMIAAIQADDRDAFVADGTDAVKKGTTKEVMTAISKELGGRLKKGFTATYLCQLKQADHQIYLWKMSFKDASDDIVVRLVLKDSKVSGFFLQ